MRENRCGLRRVRTRNQYTKKPAHLEELDLLVLGDEELGCVWPLGSVLPPITRKKTSTHIPISRWKGGMKAIGHMAVGERLKTSSNGSQKFLVREEG